MKLNYRDKIMLIVVIVALVWVGGIMLFIKPGIESISDANNKLEDAKAQRSELQQKIEADKDLDKRIDKAYKEVSTLTDSFYSINQTQAATQKVDDLLKSDDIVNENMTISEYSSYTLYPYSISSSRAQTEMDIRLREYAGEKVEAATDGQMQSADGVPIIGAYTISFDFTGKLDSLKSFCEKLRTSNTEKTMIITALDYDFDTTTEGEGEDAKTVISDEYVSGTMSLQMLVVLKMEDPSKLDK